MYVHIHLSTLNHYVCEVNSSIYMYPSILVYFLMEIHRIQHCIQYRFFLEWTILNKPNFESVGFSPSGYLIHSLVWNGLPTPLLKIKDSSVILIMTESDFSHAQLTAADLKFGLLIMVHTKKEPIASNNLITCAPINCHWRKNNKHVIVTLVAVQNSRHFLLCKNAP